MPNDTNGNERNGRGLGRGAGQCCVQSFGQGQGAGQGQGQGRGMGQRCGQGRGQGQGRGFVGQPAACPTLTIEVPAGQDVSIENARIAPDNRPNGQGNRGQGGGCGLHRRDGSCRNQG